MEAYTDLSNALPSHEAMLIGHCIHTVMSVFRRGFRETSCLHILISYSTTVITREDSISIRVEMDYYKLGKLK